MERTIPTANAIDILDRATAMLQFLADVSPALAHDGKYEGLGEKAAFGLGLIFDHINSTIDQARDLL